VTIQSIIAMFVQYRKKKLNRLLKKHRKRRSSLEMKKT
jgi:hypothetical protein